MAKGKGKSNAIGSSVVRERERDMESNAFILPRVLWLDDEAEI